MEIILSRKNQCVCVRACVLYVEKEFEQFSTTVSLLARLTVFFFVVFVFFTLFHVLFSNENNGNNNLETLVLCFYHRRQKYGIVKCKQSFIVLNSIQTTTKTAHNKTNHIRLQHNNNAARHRNDDE